MPCRTGQRQFILSLIGDAGLPVCSSTGRVYLPDSPRLSHLLNLCSTSYKSPKTHFKLKKFMICIIEITSRSQPFAQRSPPLVFNSQGCTFSRHSFSLMSPFSFFVLHYHPRPYLHGHLPKYGDRLYPATATIPTASLPMAQWQSLR